MNYTELTIHNSLPVPIKIQKDKFYNIMTNKYDYAYECICKYCSNANKYLTERGSYYYYWSICDLCKKRVWYWPQVCSLYGRRKPKLVCFYCRIPFYDKGLSNGEIYKIVKSLTLNDNNV